MTKTLLLTGASGGVGRELIKPLSDAGYNLALHYHEKIDELEAEIDRVKPKVKVACFKADLTLESDVIEMMEAITTHFGGVDILVNNAGISLNAMSWKMSLVDWQKSLDTNLTTAFLCTKHSLPYMRKNEWGRIIHVSSVVAQTGVAGASAYAASKSALFGFTKSVAKEVANKNITVNTMSYGYLDAGMINSLMPEFQEELLRQIPQKRFGPVDNVAQTILYLSSENASYITGQILPINGGLA